MAVSVTFNGTSYNVPQSGDTGWGDDVSNLLVDLAASTGLNSSTITGTTTQSGPSYVTATADTSIYLTNIAARAVTLPAGTNGRVINVVDAAGTAYTGNITITAAGTDKVFNPITGGESASLIVDSDFAAVSLQFRTSGATARWYVL